MKKLDVEARLEYARAGVAVIRALQLDGRTMPYSQFARAIGLLPEGQKWGAWYRSRTSEVLQLMHAAEQVANPSEAAKLNYACIVDARTGRSGTGIEKTSRIVRSAT